MTARKKSTTRKSSARSRTRKAIDEGLRDLEKRLPKNLRSTVRDLRSSLNALQKQVDKARQEREARWNRLESQIRSETAKLLRRLEKAVSGGGAKKASSRRKSSAKKKTSRRKPARKKTTRKKTARS